MGLLRTHRERERESFPNENHSLHALINVVIVSRLLVSEKSFPCATRQLDFICGKLRLLYHNPLFCNFVLISDLIVVIASIVVFTIGSEGQVFATSAIR